MAVPGNERILATFSIMRMETPMAARKDFDKGPRHNSQAEGYSAAYERARPQALREERDAMAGPENLSVPDNDIEMKNPDGEFARPASMSEESSSLPHFDGPNGLGNSKGDGSIDPQGQQGGTEGGQPPKPPLKIGNRPAGTVLEGAAARKAHAARPTGVQAAGGEKPTTPKGE
jgi:hypothetical protein